MKHRLHQNALVGVCGAGAMGAGIAQVAAQAGHKVVVLDQDNDALDRGRASVEKGAAALLKRGKIDEGEAEALQNRVRWTLEIDDFADVDLAIEAIVEIADVKRSLFSRLEQAVKDDAVIATNTSSLSVTGLAADLARPQRFLGLHFFNPAPIMKLVEVVSGAETDAAVAAEALALMESWGKVAVSARDAPGFIVNRVARPFYGEGWRALEEGAADAATLDFLYKDLAGFRMGPFELGDLIGHDVNTAAAKSVFDAYYGRTRFTPSLAQERLVAAGRLGRKSGRGVYDYGDAAQRPAPTFQEGAAPALGRVAIAPDASALKALLETADMECPVDAAVPAGFASIDDVLVGFAAGRTAGEERALSGGPVVLLDWMREPKAATAIAYSASCEEAAAAALAFAAACGKKAVKLKDRPGLVVFRTLAQICNCAADAARDQIADDRSIDRAMIYGVNYPFGPATWGRDVGFRQLVEALDAIAAETGEAMYRPCERLRAQARNVI